MKRLKMSKYYNNYNLSSDNFKNLPIINKEIFMNNFNDINTANISYNQAMDIAKKAESYFISNYDCITVDGVRVKFDGGWGLVRASNTQPVIVCRFEGNSPQKMNEIQDLILSKLNEFGNLEASSH